jgi:hypothetical protein
MEMQEGERLSKSNVNFNLTFYSVKKILKKSKSRSGRSIINPPVPRSDEVAVRAGVVVEAISGWGVSEAATNEVADLEEELIVFPVRAALNHEGPGATWRDRLDQRAAVDLSNNAVELGLGT